MSSPTRRGGSRIQDPRAPSGPPRVGGSMIRDSRAPMMDPGKRVGAYQLGRTVGEGTYGKVKAARNIQSGETVAIKILLKEELKKNGLMDSVNREIGFLRRITHPNIVNLKDVLMSSSKIYLVMEMVPGGDVFEHLARAQRFPEDRARRYFRQLMSGVNYCHKLGIAHRDLKPENLLLTRDDVIKISDFGLSASHEQDGRSLMLETTCGTVNYMAPEVLKKQGYNGAAADVWSCGVILYVFLAGYLPFDDERLPELTHKIVTASFTFPAWFSDQARDLLLRILQPDPKVRISVSEILQHSWVTEGLEEMEPAISPRLPSSPDPSRLAEPAAAFVKVEDEETDRHGRNPSRPAGIKSLTAFELISMTKALDVSLLIAGESSFKEIEERRLLTRTNFFVQCPDEHAVLAKLKEALDDIYYPRVTYTADDPHFKLTIRAASNVATVAMSAQLFRVSETLILVHVLRVSGDTFAFHKFFVKIRDKITHGHGFICLEETQLRPPLMVNASRKSLSLDVLPVVPDALRSGARSRISDQEKNMMSLSAKAVATSASILNSTSGFSPPSNKN